MRWMIVLSLAVIGTSLIAQERTHQITPEDYFSVRMINEIALSPDGKHVAFSLATWNKQANNRTSDLWIVATDGQSEAVQLTKDRVNPRGLKWDADNKHLYFLGNLRLAGKELPYNGSSQVWQIPAVGGDVQAVSVEADGVSSFDYASGKDTIFYSIDKEHRDNDEFAGLRKTFRADYGHGIRQISEIYQLDPKTWKRKKIIDNTRYIREFAVTADGKKIAMITAFDESVVKSEGESRVDIWEDDKTMTPKWDIYRRNPNNSPYAWLENLTWSPDGKRFAFTAVHDAYPAEVILGTARTEGWDMSRIERNGAWQVVGYGRATGAPVKLLPNNEYFVSTERFGQVNSVAGQFDMGQSSWTFPGNLLAFELTANKSVLVGLVSTVDQMAVLKTLGRKGQVLFDPNPQVASWKIPTVKHITWKAPDGTTVGGVLELPYGYKDGDKPLPLLVAMHGGPTTSTKAELSYDPLNGRFFTSAAGYAVLCPNYRGSTGYGDKFLIDLVGNENDIEVKDILAGVEHLIEKGIADKNRVGCMGWSNGGYLTNCLITLKDSPIDFKAASSGAGILDTVAEWGFNDEPAYPMVFKKGLPWETPEIYRKTSPTYGLGNVKTPTLIHVGGSDVRCPPGHSRMLYRALKEYNKVPTELVVYPGEPHGLTKYSNRLAKMKWDLAWFEKYLKNAK